MSVDRFNDNWEIDDGWDVISADGEKIGDVQDVQGHYIIASKGFFFPREKYVPVSAIQDVRDGKVYLSMTKSQLDGIDWDAEPDYDTATTYTNTGTGSDSLLSTGYADTGMAGTTGRTDYVETGTTRAAGAADLTEDQLRVQLSEEQLDVRTRQVQRGIVRVRKDVVSEQQTVNVPLREETVHVERHAVNRDLGTAPADAFTEQEFEIQLTGEEVDVTKRAVVREEVEIDTDVVERTERVSETVRREEVHIDGADTDVTGGMTRGSGRGVTDTAGADAGEGVLGRIEDRLDPTPNEGGRPTGS